MDDIIESPYLEAIRAITGETPGQKQKTINTIAKELARIESQGNVDTNIPDIPELLKPLVRVEVAKILRQYEKIIEALKSEDLSVVTRALQAKWFFDGSDDSLVNAKYFADNVFPEISLFARLKVIKNLGIYLKKPQIAADFFTAICKLYGVEQVLPLLPACEEDFAFKMIVEKKIVLSLRMVRTLYHKYPNLVIKYLMLSETQNKNVRDCEKINLDAYEDFFPEMANKHFEEFMKIYSGEKNFNVKLGKRASSTFVKRRLDLVVQDPKKYLKLVPLDLVTRKLSVEDFNKMFKNLLPEDRISFNYADVAGVLRFLKNDATERVKFVQNAFREFYGIELISCKNLISSSLMQVLPAEDRIIVAKMKLEDDKNWRINDPRTSWRCYLRTEESIPMIIKEIAKTSDVSNRCEFLKHLVYTCKVNKDENALVRVLNYVYDRHKNEQRNVIHKFFRNIRNLFELSKLKSAHWEVLNKFIKKAEMEGDFKNHSDEIAPLLESALHYCALNNLPDDYYVRSFVDVKMELCRNRRWNIIKSDPHLERKFLDIFITEIITRDHPFANTAWKESEEFCNFAMSIWEFNDRHVVPNGEVKKLSVRDYPWVLEKIENLLCRELWDNRSKIILLNELRRNESDLYKEWIMKLNKFWVFDPQVFFDVYKEMPQRVLDNYQSCFGEIFNRYPMSPELARFIVRSKSYRDLAIKFYSLSRKYYTDSRKCTGVMPILALLTDGETFTELIKAHVPEEDKMDVDDPKAKENFKLLTAITSNLGKLNPPVPLEIIANFCVGDYLQFALRSLTSVSCRVPVSKVIPFAKLLTRKKVSVMKHGIRIIYQVGTLEEIYALLSHLWDSHGHTSIRGVVYTKIYDIFCKRPDAQSWSMLKKCLETLSVDDDEDIFKNLTELRGIPLEYIHEYINTALKTLEMMEKKAEDPNIYVKRTCALIRNISPQMTEFLPDQCCQDLIKKYLFVFDYNKDIHWAAVRFTIACYVHGSEEYNEKRLNLFADHFRDSVKKYWDQTHPKDAKFYPINSTIRMFFRATCTWSDQTTDIRIFESLLATFRTVLEPHQDADSFLSLFYMIQYCRSNSPVEFGTNIAFHLPELLDYFSPQYVTALSDKLSAFSSRCRFSNFSNTVENIYIIIEYLANTGDINCAYLAVNMFSIDKSKKFDEYHNRIIQSFRKLNHPGVSAVLNKRLCSYILGDDNDD